MYTSDKMCCYSYRSFLLSLCREKRESGEVWIGEKKNGCLGIFDSSKTESIVGKNLGYLPFFKLMNTATLVKRKVEYFVSLHKPP